MVRATGGTETLPSIKKLICANAVCACTARTILLLWTCLPVAQSPLDEAGSSRFLSCFKSVLRFVFVFCVLSVLLITKMRYTQAKTCGFVSWSTRQHVKCRRHECWLTNEEFIPGQSLCMHLVQTECERIPDKPVINGDSWKSWLLNEQQLRMTSVSYGKGTSLSHLVAVFK